MEQYTEVFVGLDVAKARHAVAVAEGERQGEVRYLGEIGADTESVRRLVSKLEKRHVRRTNGRVAVAARGRPVKRPSTSLTLAPRPFRQARRVPA